MLSERSVPEGAERILLGEGRSPGPGVLGCARVVGGRGSTMGDHPPLLSPSQLMIFRVPVPEVTAGGTG